VPVTSLRFAVLFVVVGVGRGWGRGAAPKLAHGIASVPSALFPQ
jgi:cell division GTPase FtsZ